MKRARGGCAQRRGACAVLAVVIASCAFDRERPMPTVAEPASLTVEVIEPRAGATILASQDVPVRVNARDLNGTQLSGVGFVARRSGSGNNATLDSAGLSLPLTDEATREFAFSVPALPTNTQVDIFGIAYGPGTQSRMSVARSVIVVAQCPPGQPAC